MFNNIIYNRNNSFKKYNTFFIMCGKILKTFCIIFSLRTKLFQVKYTYKSILI